MKVCGIFNPQNTILSILTGFLFAFACDDTICPSEFPAEIQIAFKDIQSREIKGIRVDSIIALGSDSTFYSGDSLSTYSLPVNHLSDSTVYILFRDPGADSIVVLYDVQYNLVNKECGYSAAAVNFRAGFTTFPEAVSNNDLFIDPDDPEIEIYF